MASLVRKDRQARKATRVRLGLLVQLDRWGRKARPVLLVHKGRKASKAFKGQPERPARLGRLARKVRRVHKEFKGQQAKQVHKGHKVCRVRLVQQELTEQMALVFDCLERWPTPGFCLVPATRLAMATSCPATCGRGTARNGTTSAPSKALPVKLVRRDRKAQQAPRVPPALPDLKALPVPPG